MMNHLEGGLYQLPDGRIHVLDVDDWISRTTYYGQYERDIYQCVGRILTTDDGVLDIGANKGVFAAMSSSFVGPGGYILCVEPSPLCWKSLQTVTGLLPTRVNVATYALAAKTGDRSLYFPIDPSHSGQATLNVESVTFANHNQLVSAITLDELLSENTESFALAKIDVEGSEPEVLQGAARTLQELRVGTYLIEVSPQFLGNAWLSELWDKTASYPFKYRITTRGVLRRKSKLAAISLEEAMLCRSQWYLVASMHPLDRLKSGYSA